MTIIDVGVAEYNSLKAEERSHFNEWLNCQSIDIDGRHAVTDVRIDTTANTVTATLAPRHFKDRNHPEVITKTISAATPVPAYLTVFSNDTVRWVVVYRFPKHPRATPIEEVTYTMSTINVQDNQVPFTAAATFKDAAGDTVEPDDIPQWATNDATIATVVPSADGTSAIVTITGLQGGATVTCTSVNNSGTKIVLSGSVNVTPGDAVTGEIDFTLPPPATTGTGSPPADTPVLDPATNLPLYTWDGSTPAATGSYTAVGDVEGPVGSDGVTPEVLYTFSGDTAGQAPTGVQAGYALFQGTDTPEGAGSTGTGSTATGADGGAATS